jgi:uncharacterized protein YggE
MLKKIWLVALAAVLVVLVATVPAISEVASNPASISVPASSGAAVAQTTGKTIIVHGTSTINLKADFGSINLGVNTKGATVAEAQAANKETMDKVIAAIRDQGVAEEDIVTSSFNVYANYDYQYSKLTEGDSVSGYQVENMLMVTVRDLNKISGVLDAAMGAGANQTYGITFSSSKQAEAYDEALKAAVQDGARKAGLLAASMEKTLGDLLNMEEKEYSYNLYGGAATYKAEDSAAGTPIMSGQIAVNATVTLTYNFE